MRFLMILLIMVMGCSNIIPGVLKDTSNTSGDTTTKDSDTVVGSDTAQIVPIGPHALPSGYDWQPVGGEAQSDVPPGCGSDVLPCNSSDFTFVWPPDTGQLFCKKTSEVEVACPGTAGYSTCASTPFCGQDGQYGFDLTQSSWAQNRFVDNDNGSVSDTWTGLVWQANHGEEQEWQEAIGYCNELEQADRTDWRLPMLCELRSLTNYKQNSPASDFIGMPGLTNFWSSTSVAQDPTAAWTFTFYDGSSDKEIKNMPSAAVRCVASGP